MATLVAQIAPQRSTQYSDLVSLLAPHEITLSLLGPQISDGIIPIRLGGQDYLRFEIANLDDAPLSALANLSMTDAYFTHYDSIGGEPGPFLKPLEITANRFLPESLVATRRYRGKTNEVFTQFMCNLARYSSAYSTTDWRHLTLLDPLAGGGTTLFVGLMLGADVAGVERDKQVVDGTVAFLKEYMKEARIKANFRTDPLKNTGKRWFITLDGGVRCVVGRGDTSDVRHFVNGLKRPQLIVTDLPYGIQHRAEWQAMLVSALPAWAEVLAEGGALAFSWNASRFARDDMIKLVEEVSEFRVLNDPPYDQLAHQVDRVITQRDVIVARL